MGIKKLFQKAFVGGRWSVAYRDAEKEETVYCYANVGLPKDQWVADPFVFEHEGRHYLFCEQYETKENRAGIGYFAFENGIPVNKGIVLRRPYHMSYPCLFSYRGTVYMIPETSSNGTVELYRAVEFPHKWELDTVLLQGRYLDSTVYESEEGLSLFTYEKRGKEWILTCFALDMETRTLCKRSGKIYETNVGRPAGKLWQEDGKLYRPAQDCSEKYGEALIVYRVDSLAPLQETPVQRITAGQYDLPQKADRLHTYNTDNRYAVVDVFQEQFDLLHGWKIFKRSVLKKNRRKERRIGVKK